METAVARMRPSTVEDFELYRKETEAYILEVFAHFTC